MSSLLPYFKWYPADAEIDSEYCSLTYAERGLYHHCLNLSWMNDGLPANLAELSRILRVSKAELEELWPRVSKCFIESDGRLRNARQEDERVKAIQLSDRNKRAGNANAQRIKRECSTNDARSRELNDSQRAYESDSVSGSLKENKVAAFPSLVEQTAERMYALHPKKKNKPLVERQLVAISQKGGDLGEIEACHKLWCATEGWNEKDGQYAPKLDEWLADEGYTKRPREPTGEYVYKPPEGGYFTGRKREINADESESPF